MIKMAREVMTGKDKSQKRVRACSPFNCVAAHPLTSCAFDCVAGQIPESFFQLRIDELDTALPANRYF